ncbi:hypothetical protein HOY80DRAFT_1051833 [Tuber brumale]|nr:hypothetical protein HOY80DRAFT_1051833 [Tuber brumale]
MSEKQSIAIAGGNPTITPNCLQLPPIATSIFNQDNDPLSSAIIHWTPPLTGLSSLLLLVPTLPTFSNPGTDFLNNLENDVSVEKSDDIPGRLSPLTRRRQHKPCFYKNIEKNTSNTKTKQQSMPKSTTNDPIRQHNVFIASSGLFGYIPRDQNFAKKGSMEE